MKIPRTEKEFAKDILENCGQPSLFFNLFRNISFNNNLSWSDRVKRRIAEYGVSAPNLPETLSEEDSNDYIARIWEENADAILAARGLTIEDRSALIGTSTVNRQKVKKWLLEKEESEDWNNGWFTRLPYHERKFVTPVRSFDDYHKAAPDIQRFRISNIPSDIIFEDSIPTIGELYIAHPYRRGVYLPVSKYEHLIFRERIHELSKVMMALGATEIKTIQNSEYKSQSEHERSSKTAGSSSYGDKFGASGSYDKSSASTYGKGNDEAIVINFKNDPIELPKLPEELIWYPHEKEWQQIAENRLNGNILEYEISISSKEINLVSEFERSQIEGQVKVILASASFSRESSSKSLFKGEKAKSTSILIKFKSRKDY